MLHRPDDGEQLPAILWNHGSEQNPTQTGQTERASLFTDRGYVFFRPFRRGHEDSEGRYVLEILQESREQGGDAAWSRALREQALLHLEDQLAALNYLKGLPFVDPARIAVMGHSFGGIQAVLAAASAIGIRAVVSFCPAAMTWARSPDIRDLLLDAAAHASVPILFLQAANDFDLSPTAALAEQVSKHGGVAERRIYPPVGTEPLDGHLLFDGAPELWSEDVFAFLQMHV